MANPRGQQRDKPFRDALRMEQALAEQGQESPAQPGTFRYIARQLLIRAGVETAAAREVGDRMDGKPAQAVEMSGAIALSHEEALNELGDDGDGTADDAAGTGDPSKAQG